MPQSIFKTELPDTITWLKRVWATFIITEKLTKTCKLQSFLFNFLSFLRIWVTWLNTRKTWILFMTKIFLFLMYHNSSLSIFFPSNVPKYLFISVCWLYSAVHFLNIISEIMYVIFRISDTHINIEYMLLNSLCLCIYIMHRHKYMHPMCSHLQMC